MEKLIRDNVVCGGLPLEIPVHLSFGKYIIDKLKQFCLSEDSAECLINGITGHGETYKTLLQNIIKFAKGLKEMDVKSGDVVAVWSRNGAEVLIAIIGSICAGASVTAFSLAYTRDEIIYALSISHPKIIIGSEELLRKAMDIFKSSSEVVKIIQLDGMPLDYDIISYKDVMVDTDIWNYEATEVHGESDLAFILYSSGTTGLPKGVMLTHVNVLYGVIIMSEAVDSDNVKMLTVLTWNHVYGLFTTIASLLSNKTVVYLPKYKPDTFLKIIEEFKIKVIMAVPPVIVVLAKSNLIEKYDLSSVEIVWSSSAPLSVDIASAATKRLPNCKGIFQGFGMTEIVTTVIKEDKNNSARELGSCGYPLPGIKVKVVNIDNGEKLGANQEGLICINGPTIMKGYMNDESATRDIIDDEGYLKTGDIGYYNSDGCFFIVDRAKELIKYKGHQVPPASIEKLLLQHNGIADCGVIGAPDELAGELPTAFVVPKDGYSLTEAELLHFTNERLSPIHRLRGGIIFVNKIPRNISGKILRKDLKRMLYELHKE